jgi:hypothetical protein
MKKTKKMDNGVKPKIEVISVTRTRVDAPKIGGHDGDEDAQDVSKLVAQKGCFQVLRKMKTVTYLTLKGRDIVLSHHDSPIFLNNGRKIDPPTQGELKAIYDESPAFAELVKCPANYDAPWVKFQNISDLLD